MYTLLSIAKAHHASDLHITVGVRPKCRISGTLYEMDGFEKLTPAMTKELVESMFGPKQKATMEATGEVDFAYTDTRVGRFRVNAFHQRGSYAAVLRIVASDIPTPEALGIPEAVLGLTKKKRGLVLVTGPTGSGKSTTLASLIDVINKERNEHIITLEDPIEYLHKHNRSIVNQREIGLDTDSYGNALRAALREDPDIILVGEMRDFDTISTAITAAETGHLVFSTLHTIGAAPTIERIVDVFPPHQQNQIRSQLASVLEAVISQQLLPTMIRDYMPMWLRVLFFGAVLSAVMSTASATILAPSTTFVENVLKNFTHISEKNEIRTMRATVLVFTLLVLVYALSVEGTAIYDMVAMAYQFPVVGAFWPLVMGLYWKKATRLGAISSILLGGATWIILTVTPLGEVFPSVLGGFIVAGIGMIAGSLIPVKSNRRYVALWARESKRVEYRAVTAR